MKILLYMVCRWRIVAGSLEVLQIVLDIFNEHGGALVCNVIKCHLFTKPEFVRKANKKFSGWNVDFIEGLIVFSFHLLALIKVAKFLWEKRQWNTPACSKNLPHMVGSPLRIFTNLLQVDCNISWLSLLGLLRTRTVGCGKPQKIPQLNCPSCIDQNTKDL